MQGAAFTGQSFDRRDRLSLRGGRQGQARQHAASDDKNGASPALSLIAALFAACQADMLAQGIEQRRAHVHIHLVAGAIDFQLQRYC